MLFCTGPTAEIDQNMPSIDAFGYVPATPS